MTVNQRTAAMLRLISSNPNMSVPWFLMTSWTYYLHDFTLVTDLGFEEMVRLMSAKWSSIDHRHKHLITLDMLSAGTAYALRDEDYPSITKSSATLLAIEDKHLRLHHGKWVRKT